MLWDISIHPLVIGFFSNFVNFPLAVEIGLVILLTIIASAISYHLLEKKLIELGRNLSKTGTFKRKSLLPYTNEKNSLRNWV